ncbi:unnamed protein product [Echinostoma caproni]|uniref:DBD_Tnp_Mut domain-containing protein n=1 Tax=Echinostoma caproni TaxID=27848 RepID=A0A183B8W4_9TREM|nr:unnamed protein product [Echinostoma caproni]
MIVFKRASEKALRVQLSCRLQYEVRLAEKARTCPKVFYSYVHSKAAAKEADATGTHSTTNSVKSAVLREFFERVHRADYGREPENVDSTLTGEMSHLP